VVAVVELLLVELWDRAVLVAAVQVVFLEMEPSILEVAAVAARITMELRLVTAALV
jgi:hypothetical protein